MYWLRYSQPGMEVKFTEYLRKMMLRQKKWVWYTKTTSGGLRSERERYSSAWHKWARPVRIVSDKHCVRYASDCACLQTEVLLSTPFIFNAMNHASKS